MNYECALLMKRSGLQHRGVDIYQNHLWQKYDIQMFLDFLDEGREEVDYKRFFDLIQKQHEEWINKDLVVDTRETWKQFFKRQINFDDPPMVPREELPEEFQPHRSFYGKLSCFLNNIDPYPPKPRENDNLLGNQSQNQSISGGSHLNDIIKVKQATQNSRNQIQPQTDNSLSMADPEGGELHYLDQPDQIYPHSSLPKPTEQDQNLSQKGSNKHVVDLSLVQKTDDDQVYTFHQEDEDQESNHVEPDPGTYAINNDPQQRMSLLDESRRKDNQSTSLKLRDIEDLDN